MQLSDLIALAALMRPPPGPQIPALPKAESNVTATPMSRAALNNPPMSDPAAFLGAMTSAAGVPSEIQLRQAQVTQANALADALKAATTPPPPMFGPGAPSPLVPMTLPDSGSFSPPALQPAGGMLAGGALGGGTPGGKVDFGTARQLAQQAGFQGDAADKIAAISLAESSGNPFAANEKGEHSYGITQINADAHGPVAREAYGNPLRAMQLAYDVSKGGADFSPWTMFKNGEYQKYLPGGTSAPAPAPAADPSFGSLAPGGPAPSVGMPSGVPQFNPAFLSWAQQQDRLNAILGKRNPIALEEALKFQFAPLNKQLDLSFAGPMSAAQAGGQFPYQAALKNLEANNALRNAGPIALAQGLARAQAAYSDPANNPELQTKLNAAKTIGEKQGVLLAAGINPASPDGQAALRNTIPDTRPDAVRVAEAAGLAGPDLNTALAGAIPGNAPTAPMKEATVYEKGTSAQQEALQRAQRNGQPINIGTIPPDYQAVPTPEGGLRMQIVPGSPTDLKQQEQARQQKISTGIVTEDINRALPLVNYWTAGPVGSLTQRLPGTESHNLQELLSGVGSNIALGSLQQQRAASPTGGALGNVSNKDVDLLKSTYGSLEQSQTPDQLRYNLERMRETYTDVVFGSKPKLDALLRGGNITQEQYDAAIAAHGTQRQQSGAQRYIYDPQTKTIKPAP